MTVDESAGTPDRWEDERVAWNRAAAAWRTWWPVFEAGAQPLNEELVRAAGVAPGMKVLDVATGIGEPALTAARALQGEGVVVGVDLAVEMTRLAGERAVEAGLDAVTRFVVAAAEELDPAALGVDAFDAATSRWGLMLCVDPVAAARAMRRVVRPGGRLAVAVWGPPETAPFLSMPMRALRDNLDLPPPDPATPGPFRLADEAELREVLREGGWADVEVAAASVTFEFESVSQYLAFVQELSTRTQSLLAECSAAQREAALAQLAASAAECATDDGRVRLTNQCHVAVAHATV